MRLLHMYTDMIAIGDAAFNICRAYAAMEKGFYDKVIIHTQAKIKIANGNILTVNSDAFELFKRTYFIKDILVDTYIDDLNNLWSKSYNVRLEIPVIYRQFNNIKNWINLDDLTPEVDTSKRIALFQPISLRHKPIEYLDTYIPIWTKCLEALLAKDYHIVMVGATDDPIYLSVVNKFMPFLDNKIGKWSILESVAFILNKADVVLSCDSFAGVWGIASRKPTAIAFGYRMEKGIDKPIFDFLGNKDIYQWGLSSNKKECDNILSKFLLELEIKDK